MEGQSRDASSTSRPSNPPLPAAWMDLVGTEFSQSYMKNLREYLGQQLAARKTIFPKKEDIFRCFEASNPQDVRVVILGQDPYHGPGQAHGLCFSVPAGVRPPPSLMNIFKELKRDLHIAPPKQGTLEAWSKQGVLLLNAVLTVEAGQAASHQGRGWETFTDRVILRVAEDPNPKVFMLWGNYAMKKASLIRSIGKDHLILQAPHPSPLSAHRGFLGCGHFSQANVFLRDKGLKEIDWSL